MSGPDPSRYFANQLKQLKQQAIVVEQLKLVGQTAMATLTSIASGDSVDPVSDAQTALTAIGTVRVNLS